MERHPEYTEPTDVKQRLRERALAYIDISMYKEAIVEYEKIIKLDARDYRAYQSYIDLAITLEENKEIEKSIECYRDALKFFPDNSFLYTNLGYCFSKYSKRPDIAMVCYEKALELDPFDCVALNNIGSILARAGKLQEALSYFKEAMRVEYREGKMPGYTAAHNAARAYYLSKDYEHALILYGILKSSYPDKIPVCTEFACLYYRMGRLEEALEMLDSMLYQYPNSRHCLRLYNLIREKLDKSGY